MNQTTNYNFNVPVGSDIVNPLVQDFPNWESLDTILKNVANTGITTATHTKTGTIHTLTFSETTVPMIRFQATADFNTNDTFTVNGVSVSALTVSGVALPDGAFVIGSMVLCELRDNLLTVYASGTDADTLEGHPASYFATDSDLQTVDGKADANKALIDQINIDLANKVNGTATILYEEVTTRDGNGSYIDVNSNALSIGYVSMTKINKQITIHIGGVTTKTGLDWLIRMKSGYRPDRQEWFPCYVSSTLTRGYIQSDGYIYIENLGNALTVSADIIFNVQ